MLKDDPAAVAARLRSSPIKDQIVAALDDWAGVALRVREQTLAEQLLAVARQVMPDPAWGDRLRQLKVRRDREALGKLMAEAPPAGLSPQLLDLVGEMLRDDMPLQESWLRRAQAAHPADFWLSYSLASVLCKTNPLEAAGFYRVALALRPGSSTVYGNLGMALFHQEKQPEAIAAFRKAIEIDPKDAIAHNLLGNSLASGEVGRGHRVLPQGHRARPEIRRSTPQPRKCLGEQHRLDEAIAWHRKAIELDPKHVNAHIDLGNDLYSQRKLDEAIAWYRKASELDPKKSRHTLTLAMS